MSERTSEDLTRREGHGRANPYSHREDAPVSTTDEDVERQDERAIRPPSSELRTGPGGGGRFIAAGVPAEKSMDFGGTVRRLGRRMRKERLRVVAVFALAICSVSLIALGPRVLGHATNIIVAGLQGSGIDFGDLRRVLLTVVGLYLIGGVLAYLQSYTLAGIVQRTMYRLRTDVEDKLNRLPLSYIDQHARGDLLSRVTNDIDNVAQSLQQSLSQLLTSCLTLIAVMVMMLSISPLLALVAIVTIPLSLFAIKRHHQAGRAAGSWRSGGTRARSTRRSRRPSPGTPS